MRNQLVFSVIWLFAFVDSIEISGVLLHCSMVTHYIRGRMELVTRYKPGCLNRLIDLCSDYDSRSDIQTAPFVRIDVSP